MPSIIEDFIVIEGLDGAGTTTQANLLQKRLAQSGKTTIMTFEPTDHTIGKLIRSILKGEQKVEPKTLAYLFAADRHEHLFGSNGILEKTKNNEKVICDRYFFSSLAYQSPLCGWDFVKQLNDSFPLPQYLFFLEASPALCGSRRDKRREDEEIYENTPYQIQVDSFYQKALKTYKESGTHLIFIDGSQSIEKINQEIWSYL